MGKLSTTVTTVDDLPDTVKADMFDLFARYYDDVSISRFSDDLVEKDGVILLHDKSGRLRGFSSYLVFEQDMDDQPCRFIFSGDTIIDHRFWGDHALAFAWLRLTGTIKRQQSDVPLYWFLIVKGYRTYRYLPVFAKEFYPSCRAPTPAHIHRIIDKLAISRFGPQYDSRAGVVRFAKPQGRLKPRWLAPPPQKATDPDISFFLQSNPGHDRGDELVCISELSQENMPPLAARVFSGEQP